MNKVELDRWIEKEQDTNVYCEECGKPIGDENINDHNGLTVTIFSCPHCEHVWSE